MDLSRLEKLAMTMTASVLRGEWRGPGALQLSKLAGAKNWDGLYHHDDHETGTRLILTLEDEELQLSLSFWSPEGRCLEKDEAKTELWLQVFFSERRSKVLVDPPQGTSGPAKNVWHYRLPLSEI